MQKETREAVLGMSANPVYVQMGADPQVYTARSTEIRESRKACFIGQRYADRDVGLRRSISADVPLVIYGPGWNERSWDSQIWQNGVIVSGSAVALAGSLGALTLASGREEVGAETGSSTELGERCDKWKYRRESSD